MKLIYSLALGLLVAWCSPAQSFKMAKGNATDVSISKKGEVFVVGTSKRIFKYDFNTESFKLHAAANKSAKSLAAAQEKFVYLLTTDGRMHISYANNTNNMGAMGSVLLKDIYVGNNNALWGIDSKGAVRQYKSGWKSFPLAGNGNKKVCINDSGRVFVVKNDNRIFNFYNGKFTKLPGAATDIAYDHLKKKLYILDLSNQISVWNPGRKKWDVVNNSRNDFKTIAVHNGQLWGTTRSNKIYTTAPISGATASGNNGQKLKITLTKVECLKNGDGGNNADDYFLEFFATLSVANRNLPLSGKEYLRLKSHIEEFGENRNLYIDYRHRVDGNGILGHDGTWYFLDDKEQRFMQKRQLHVLPRKMQNINNSGYYKLPASQQIKPSNSQFYITAALSEITDRKRPGLRPIGSQITKIIGEKKKINLPLVLDYLLKKKNKGDFSYSKAPYYRMGTGYAGLTLDQDASGHRSMSGYFYGLSRKDRDGTEVNREAKVYFTIELIK